MIIYTNALRRTIEGYLQHNGISARRLGQEALSDPGLVADLNRGRSLRISTADRLLRFMGHEPIGSVFRKELETFLAITKMKPYLLGLHAAHDPSFVHRVRNGVSPRLATVDRVRQWMHRVCTDHERTAIHQLLEHCMTESDS